MKDSCRFDVRHASTKNEHNVTKDPKRQEIACI